MRDFPRRHPHLDGFRLAAVGRADYSTVPIAITKVGKIYSGTFDTQLPLVFSAFYGKWFT